ncbi:MAG TPA: type IV toxin-antitoxin system AbiEi family antitoxin domain-containing protein [Pseudonocardiaceae bacterium]|nr:type IV toxin-antitoxin system AbiEi family antitoxin domain-containing protein [Pseudonocardiaceae bacterium]
MSAALDDLPATFTTHGARDLGWHPRDLYHLRDSGDVYELSRGVYRRADAPTPSWPDLLAVGTRIPRGIVCCVSALVVHGLTDEIPGAVQVAVARTQRPPRIDHPPVEVFRFADDTFELGLSSVEVAPGESTRIYSAERTVIDMMRLRRRLGELLALGALRRYLRRRNARPGELLSMARSLNVLGPVRMALDVASAE